MSVMQRNIKIILDTINWLWEIQPYIDLLLFEKLNREDTWSRKKLSQVSNNTIAVNQK